MNDCTTQMVSISMILVSSRIRKDVGGIADLTIDIMERGLINPITITDCGNGSYHLIAGLRRLEACKSLGYNEIRSTILTCTEADELLNIEYAENVQRKDFTTAERLDYADKIKAVEIAKARARKSIHARDGYSDKWQDVGKRPHPESGKSRDYIAKKAGFTSSRQHFRAQRIAIERPELLDLIDAGKMTIGGAYKQIANNAGTEIPLVTSCPPILRTPEKKRKEKTLHATHNHLMKYLLYAELWEKCKQAVYDANTASTELKIRIEGYENRIRGYQENVDAQSRRCKALEEENALLRAQIDALSIIGESL